MPAVKTETITVRIAPHIKAGLREVAAQEHRSLANMLEVMIRGYCDQAGVAIAEPDTEPKAHPNTA